MAMVDNGMRAKARGIPGPMTSGPMSSFAPPPARVSGASMNATEQPVPRAKWPSGRSAMASQVVAEVPTAAVLPPPTLSAAGSAVAPPPSGRSAGGAVSSSSCPAAAGCPSFSHLASGAAPAAGSRPSTGGLAAKATSYRGAEVPSYRGSATVSAEGPRIDLTRLGREDPTASGRLLTPSPVPPSPVPHGSMPVAMGVPQSRAPPSFSSPSRGAATTTPPSSYAAPPRDRSPFRSEATTYAAAPPRDRSPFRAERLQTTYGTPVYAPPRDRSPFRGEQVPTTYGTPAAVYAPPRDRSPIRGEQVPLSPPRPVSGAPASYVLPPRDRSPFRGGVTTSLGASLGQSLDITQPVPRACASISSPARPVASAPLHESTPMGTMPVPPAEAQVKKVVYKSPNYSKAPEATTPKTPVPAAPEAAAAPGSPDAAAGPGSEEKKKEDGPKGEPVAYDEKGRPTIVRWVDPDTGAGRTVVQNKDNSQRSFGEGTVQSLLRSEKAEVEKWASALTGDLNCLELRGLAHELGQRLLNISQQYGTRHAELKKIGENMNFAYFGLDKETATLKDLENAYRKLARAMHPDKNGGTDEAKVRFQKMKERYEELKAWFAENRPKEESPPQEEEPEEPVSPPTGGARGCPWGPQAPGAPDAKEEEPAEEKDAEEEEAEEEKKPAGAYDPKDKDSMVEVVSRYAKQLRDMNGKMEVLVKELNKAKAYAEPP